MFGFITMENIYQKIIVFLLRPAYGGRDCPGSAFDYQMCNTEECAGPYEDFRAQQCVQRSNKYHKNIKHTWLPYEHPDGEFVESEAELAANVKKDAVCRRQMSFLSLKLPGWIEAWVCFVFAEARKCELSCKSKETGEVVFMNQVMHDGTRCSYSDPFSVCARGECLVGFYANVQIFFISEAQRASSFQITLVYVCLALICSHDDVTKSCLYKFCLLGCRRKMWDRQCSWYAE